MAPGMRGKGWLVCAAWLVAARAGSAAQDAAPAEAGAVLEQWVRTRQTISKVRSDWQAEREMLEQTRLMLEGELKSLETELSQVQTQSTAVARERAEAEARKEEFEQALNLLASRLPRLEQRMRKLAPLFPEPLNRTVQPLLDRLAQEAGLSQTRRLQALVTLLNEVEKFHTAVTLHPELRTGPGGKPVRVTVLYLGLGQGWYVDENGRVAGRGVPVEGGWRWVEDPALASRIREAVEVYEGKRPARFVNLPVEIR